MPARKPWSSSNEPRLRLRKRGSPSRSTMRLASSAGSSTSGPSLLRKAWDRISSSRRIATSEAEYSRSATSAVSSATRSERLACAGSPGASIRHTPYSWLWLYRVSPLSKQVSRALPCGEMASIRRPTRPGSNGFSAGKANHTRTSSRPTAAAASRSAARRISGPSGTSDRCHAPAVDGQRHAIDVAGGWRAEKGDHRADLGRLRKAPGGYASAHRLADFVFGLAFLGHAVAHDLFDASGFRVAGQNVVDRDAIGPEFARQRLGPARDRAAYGVGYAEIGDRLAHRGRNDVDDPAPGRGAHPGQHRLHQCVIGDEVLVERIQEGRDLGVVRRPAGRAAGIVDQDMDRSLGCERAHSLAEFEGVRDIG